ncbi:hypothetical protein K505DRAFT_59325 [Melanomma pulvis-pyrius CBS 109.77]|uniref:Uncharacterized protein n=1 Tax=Melanomma pulvis-pyrius CBS 109.77 TaxID=1314802 RepID=A0A6A6X6W2_9PLEO|nr:hypothetical protein K505DRAFT_59325 [Melanomma pulvis-pyrius CBS 109.77]
MGALPRASPVRLKWVAWTWTSDHFASVRPSYLCAAQSTPFYAHAATRSRLELTDLVLSCTSRRLQRDKAARVDWIDGLGPFRRQRKKVWRSISRGALPSVNRIRPSGITSNLCSCNHASSLFSLSSFFLWVTGGFVSYFRLRFNVHIDEALTAS